jgi:phospholipid/cholesterol/gamma-HCH transport system substrate-binding protein
LKLKNDIKVGLFVLLGLVLAGLVIFLIGNERRLFDPAVTFHARFKSVEGLKGGAPVEMGGVRIGHVEKVGYDEEDDPRVHVVLSIVSEQAHRIREDSVVTIVPKGMLGDRQVKIEKGTEGDIVEPGSELQSQEPKGMLDGIGKVAGKAETTMEKIDKVAESLSNEDLHKDIRESAHSINIMLKHVTDGEGYPNRFLTSKDEADRISNVIENLDQTTKELSLTLREVRRVAQRVRTGPGFVHDVIYRDGPQKEIGQIGFAANEIGLTLKGIREGDGFARDVLFGGNGDAQDALKNITTITADLRDIVRGVKDGKGTLGALLVDPSIYEDLKRVLGNVERNSVLRALVRYSIKKDQDQTKVKVVGEKED